MPNAASWPTSMPSVGTRHEERSVGTVQDVSDEGVSDEGGQAAEPAPLIDWAVAERVARWVAGRTTTPPTYRPAAMQRDFDELTARAEGLVAEATGLAVLASPARGRVIDRPA